MDSMAIHSMTMGANGVGVVDVVDESKIFAKFEMAPKLMVFASENAGHQVYENKEYVIVHQPGERDPIRKEATDMDRRRFPQAYALFKAGQTDTPTGTPIAVIFPGNPAAASTFSGLGIHTVEQLASVNDAAVQNIPFGFDCRKKARDYVQAQEGAEGFNKLNAQLDAKDSEIKSLQMSMQQMQEDMRRIQAERAVPTDGNTISGGMTADQVIALVNTMMTQAPEKRGPGRPRKEEN